MHKKSDIHSHAGAMGARVRYFDIYPLLGYNVCMADIDEVKEILNTLRVAMSIGFGIFILIVGKLTSLYQDGDFSEVFWMTVVASLLDMLAILLIVKKIAAKTKEIKDL